MSFQRSVYENCSCENDANHTWHSWLDQKFEPDMESQQVMGPYFAEALTAQKPVTGAKQMQN